MQKTFQAPLKYSQNFIQSSNLVNKLIRLSDIKSEDIVLEIGTGKGVITNELLKIAKKVITIEKDKTLFISAKEKFKDIENVDVYSTDFLQFDLNRLGKYKVFSNIPFSISAEILKKLLFAKNPPISSYLFLSEDVANKFLAKNSKETLSSLTTKPFYNIKVFYRFNKQDFFPVPKVKVLFVEFELIENPIISRNEVNDYVNFITYTFNQWKPNIKLSLKNIFSYLQLKILAKNIGFNLNAKPSEVTLSQWIQVFKEFKNIVPDNKRSLIYGSENRLINNQRKMRKRNLRIIESK